MLTKNLTPFQCAAKPTSVRPPQPAISVVVRATFNVGDDGALRGVTELTELRPLSGGIFAEDDHELTGPTSVPGDFADFKPRAEVLLKATCHAQNGKATAESHVMVQIEKWSKALRVTGRRVWGGSPAPFTAMPIDWAHTYGGPGFAKNPAGTGHASDEMPNVTRAADVLSGRGTAVEPASYGPINPRWPQRAPLLGSNYGAEYAATRAPFYASDFDWSFFQEAPPDQWLEGFLRGDETVVFQNLHPRVPTLAVKLPGLLTRVFFREQGGALREISMHLDTLFADLDAARLELSWRGVADVHDDELDDVKTLLVASEPLFGDGAKKALQHYDAIARAFEADPSGIQALLPTEHASAPTPTGELPKLAPVLESLGPSLQTVEAVDLVAFVDAAVGEAGKRPEVTKALRERESAPEPEPPPPRVTRPGGMPYMGLRRRVRSMIESAREQRDKALAAGVAPERLGQLMSIEQIADDQRWLQLDPAYTPPEPLSTCAPGPGADLRDRDLRGLDLARADLRGANLEGAILIATNLEGAQLQGARLHGAILFKARLGGANLEGADLARCHAGHLHAPAARFDGAELDQAFFEDADLTGASFVSARGEYVIFTRAKLAKSRFGKARLANAELDDAELFAADFSGAQLRKASFGNSRCARADFSRADLAQATFAGADVSSGRFFDASADGAVFTSTSATQTIFAFARLRRSQMDRLSARGADFHGADLFHARLRRASCEGASFSSANLFSADLTKAKLDAAKFGKANLYDANLTQSSHAGCDFSGANLKRSSLERA